MGTNFYMLTGRKNTVTCDCGFKHRIAERLHVGKSSYGRYFTLQKVTTKEGIVLDDFNSWRKFYNNLVLEGKSPKFINEYGEQIDASQMWDTITREKWDRGLPDFDPSLIGKDVKKGNPGDYYGDVWGERGFIHSKYAPVGKDGLYVVLDCDFS